MAQAYDSKDNSTNCYYLYVHVNPFLASDNPYAFTGASQMVYVRGFTGTTEEQAIDNTSSAGGSWISMENYNNGRARLLLLYGRPPSASSLVFARIEVYWPGMSQKGIKYSKMPVLCGFGVPSTNNYRGYYSGNEGEVEVWLNGEKKNQYLTYGEARDSIRNLTDTWYLPYYLTSGVTPDMEITHPLNTTADTFYKQFLSGTTNPKIAASIFTAYTSDNKYKTVSEIAWNKTPGCAFDTMPKLEECYVYDSECDEDLVCGRENCAECSTYSCQMQIQDYCQCYSMDLTPECNEELSFFDTCEYIPLGCMFTKNINYKYVSVTDLHKLYEPSNKTPVLMQDISYRVEGQFRKETTNYGFNYTTCIRFSPSSSNPVQYDGTRYLDLVTSGMTNGKVRLRFYTSGNDNLSDNSLYFDSDIDLTIGNKFIYDNIGQTTLVSGGTYSNTTPLYSFFINLYALRLTRLRVYNQGNLFLDIRPVAATCTKGNLTLTQKFGVYDSINSKFFPLGFVPSSAFTTCAPVGYNEGDVVPVDCLTSTDKYNDYLVHINDAVLGIPVSTMKLQFEGTFNPPGSANYYYISHFATYSTNGTGTTNAEFVTRFDTSGRTSNIYAPDFRLSYSGYTASPTISGVETRPLYGRSVDLIFGNRYVKTGNVYVYSASTQNCTQTQRRLSISLGYGKVFRRLRVYDGDTLVRDYLPGAMVYNGLFVPALREAIGGTAIRLSSSALETCPVPIVVPQTSFLLKCVSENSVYYQKNYQEGDTIDKTLIGIPTSVGKTFVQWLPAIPDVMPDHDVTVNAQYTVNQYTIYYYVDGALYTQQSYLYGAVISQPTPPTPPTGYVFSGWDIPYNTMPAFDVNVYGTMDVYVPKYTINFYSGSTSWGSTPSCNRFKTAEYAQGATISYPTVSDTCHPLAYGDWKLSCTGGTNAPATMPGNSLNVYCVTGYKVSTIHWMAKATGSTYTEYETEDAEYLDSIDGGPDLSTYAPSGYEWRGWGDLVPFSMPCEDKYVYGTFYKEAAIYYTYTLYANGQVFLQRQYEAGETIPYSGSDSVIGNLPSTTGSCSITWSTPQPYITEMPSSNVSATTVSSRLTHDLKYYVDNSLYSQQSAACGSSITPIALPNEPGYSYSSWNPSVPSTMPDNDVEVYSESTHILYHIYYYKNNSLWATDDYYYGENITPHELPTDVGKTYSDWNPSLPSTMPNNNISTYSSSAGTQYQIYYYLYNMSGSTSSTLYTTRTFTYQQAVSSLAGANPPTGQSFSGWTGEPSTMPANDVYVSGWTIPISYTLSWYYDGSLVATDTYNYTDSVYIRPTQGTAWSYSPSLLSGSKMPPSNVTATSDYYCPSECTLDCPSQCSCDSQCSSDCSQQCSSDCPSDCVCENNQCSSDCPQQCSCDNQCSSDCPSQCSCDDDVCSCDGECLKEGSCWREIVPCTQHSSCPSECTSECTQDSVTYYSLTYTLFYSTYNVSNVSQMRTELNFWVGNTNIGSETIYLEAPGNGQSYGGTYSLSFQSDYAGNWASVTADIYVKTSSGSSLWLGPYSPDGNINGIYLESGSAGSDISFTFTYSG